MRTRGWHWQEEVANRRIHATTKEQPCELFKREQLIGIEQTRPYRLVSKTARKVSAEGFVHYLGSRYSVMPEAVGKTVLVEHDGQTIRVKSADLIIAEHQLSVRRNADVINPEHQAQMWKLSLGRMPIPSSRKLQVIFNEQVAVIPLMKYEEVIG